MVAGNLEFSKVAFDKKLVSIFPPASPRPHTRDCPLTGQAGVKAIQAIHCYLLIAVRLHEHLPEPVGHPGYTHYAT